MSTKAALKAAKTALDGQDYDKAIEQAENVLSSDSQNFFARLFLGRALEKKGKYEESARTYHAAAASKPDDAQAWLGLCSVYEAQEGRKLDEYREAAVKAAQIVGEASEDKERCQTIIDKLVAFTKKHGDANHIKNVLRVMIPGSPIYDLLEGRIPHPSHTFTRLAELTETEETQRMKQEIATRRTRIGARVNQVTIEVKREVFGSSDLEDLYQQVINWSSDDEIRRQYEEKLLERAHEVLVVLPSENKASKLDQVLTLAEGMVIIHHPFVLAWDLVLESRDLDDLRGLDAGIIREYIELFPDSGIGRILKAWLTSELSPFPAPKTETDTNGEDVEAPLTPEDRLLLMTEGILEAKASPFAHRLVADYHLHLEENQSAMEIGKSGIKALATQSELLGLALQNTKDALNSVLGTAFVHHQAPRHHAEARRLFEDILQRKPKFTPALIGLGLIFEETEDFVDAVRFLSQALEEDKGNVRVGTELAWCKAQSGDYRQAQVELEDLLQRIRADDPRTRDLRAQTLYRIGVCIWESDSSKAARKDRNGSYSRFLAAIKTNINHASSYTSLGFYYQDYAKDRKRARQCFQKAFELSSAEVVAAEHLAKHFADQGDWDIVEVIAQRVVDSGRTRPPPGSKKKGISWPYSALGVVQMSKQEYQQAIVSFLSALRISPNDYQSFIGLGESYHNSGRYNSALRTFNHALAPGDDIEMKVSGETWFAQYMLANVHRELGDFDEAITRLQAVLQERPAEFGVQMSLLQTFVERSTRNFEMGVFGQAVQSAIDAIEIAGTIVQDNASAFNLWKATGDACAVFSVIQSGNTRFPKQAVSALLDVDTDEETYRHLEDIDGVSKQSFNGSLDDSAPLTSTIPVSQAAAILCYKRAIHCSSNDIHAQAVAWYNLGWAEQRAHACSTIKAGKRYLRAAVRCFKRAIELEAGNAELWNALGIVTTTLNPKVAQHAFVRSLHLNELNAKVWANLGVLYLQQNDLELAHQAFSRSQSTDPDYAHAWVGEGLISLLSGDVREALNHFTHAFEIADSTSKIVKRQYTISTFDDILANNSTQTDLTKLVQPLFALDQLRSQNPSELPSRHLASLLLERVGNYTIAMETLAELCSLAEAEYEASESLAALARFALAKSDLARNQLAVHDFDSAAENAETALDLSSDAESSGLDAEARRKLRLSAHLTAGLARFKLSDIQESIAMFRAALVESSNDPDVVCSLVRVLWAQGGEDERSVAREQLLESVEKDPEHVGAVTLLGAMALLDSDEETALAVGDDVLTLRTKQGLKLGEQDGIESLLSALAALTNSDESQVAERMRSAVQNAIVLKPDHPRAWSELAEMSGDSNAATMALKTAANAVPPAGEVDALELAEAFAGVGTAADAQRAMFLAPWDSCGWTSMSQCLEA
jgi:superkiller protein 3